jgi:ATP-binding cassette, subfamily G (WHITE), member 2
MSSGAGTSTVEEYLRFNAKLRLPSNTSADGVSDAVAGLLRRFSLEKCAGSRIGDSMLRGISGGEKRRLSIAAELFTKPHILLVDEATTGLDATSAKHVVMMMEQLSAAGITIVMSIHQPRHDIFAMMSHLLLLSGSGRTVYSGVAASAEDHFAHMGYRKPARVNTADFILDLVVRSSPVDVAHMIAAFEQSEMSSTHAQQSGAMQYASALGGSGSGALGLSSMVLDDISKRCAPVGTQV